jgi:hypothetical protein
MFKRVTWFVAGTAAGVAGATAAKKSVKKKAATLPPVKAAKQAISSVQSAKDRVTEAARDGRDAMRQTEARLKAMRNGDEIAPVEVIDGRIVATGDIKPGQVIVLKEVRDARASDPAAHSKSKPKRRPRRAS